MHFYGGTMEYSNADLPGERTALSCMKLPEVCIPVYREIVKEMAEVIKDAQMRDIFYSLSTGGGRTECFQKDRYYPQKSGIYV